MGAGQISLGRTALAPKAQIGAKAQPMCGYIRHRNPTLNLAVPSILALLPTPDEAPERLPFKSVAWSSIDDHQARSSATKSDGSGVCTRMVSALPVRLKPPALTLSRAYT